MRKRNTKMQILDVAQDLVQRVGVNSMSYKDIAESIGIRKASVHTHYPKKDDLLKALLERYNNDTLFLIDRIVKSDVSPETKLRSYCQLYEATLGDSEGGKVCLYAMVGAELATLNDPLLKRVQNFYRKNELQLSVILEEGRQSGDFKFAGDVQIMAELIFSLLEGGMLIARAHGGAQKLHKIIEKLIFLVKN